MMSCCPGMRGMPTVRLWWYGRLGVMTAMPRLAQKSAMLQNWYSESENMPCRPTRQGTATGAGPVSNVDVDVDIDAEAEPEVELEVEPEIDVDSMDRGTINRAYTVSPRLLYLTSYSRYHGEDPNRTSAAARGDSAS